MKTGEPLRLGAMMCAFKEKRLIEPAIRQFDDLLEEVEVIVACSKTSWYGGQKADNTAEMAVRAGATVRLFDWKDEKDQKNWIMDKMADKDWILMFAPDMYMTKESLNNLIYFLRSKSLEEHDRAYGCDMITYWKDYDTAIDPFTPFNTVAIRPSERFAFSARIDHMGVNEKAPGVLMHHLSWVKTDDEVKKKITTWSHAPEITEDWFENVWLGKEELKNFNPTNPTDYKRLVEYSLSDELKELIVKYSK